MKATKDIRLVEISTEKLAELANEYPYYTDYVVESDVYGTDGDTTTAAVMAMLVVSEELDEDLVYDITKAMFENLDQFSNAHQQGENITLDSALTVCQLRFILEHRNISMSNKSDTHNKKARRFGAAFLFIILSLLILVLMRKEHYLQIYDEKEQQVIWEAPIQAGETFYHEYLHSVSLTPVQEYYQMNDEGVMVATESRVQSFGAGIPYEKKTSFCLSMAFMYYKKSVMWSS